MKYLLAGGAGFIGHHLTTSLLAQGHSVVSIDNLRTGSLENVNPFLENDRYNFLEHDVLDPFDIEADVYVNLACPASPVHYQKDPINTLLTNFNGTHNVLKAATRYKGIFFQASTSEIYGDPERNPQREDYWGNVNTTGIRSCYDEGKRSAEALIADFGRVHGLDYRIARIFNTYGPNMALNDGRVVSNFIIQALENRPITIYGDGSQTRSFQFVSDLVAGINKMIESPHPGPINLGNPYPVSMLTLANEIIGFTGSSSEIVFEELPKDDPKLREPDISRAKSLLGWEPVVSRHEGILATITYFKGKLGH